MSGRSAGEAMCGSENFAKSSPHQKGDEKQQLRHGEFNDKMDRQLLFRNSGFNSNYGTIHCYKMDNYCYHDRVIIGTMVHSLIKWITVQYYHIYIYIYYHAFIMD